MPPDPDITTVAELEPFGLSTHALEILDDLGYMTIDDLYELTEADIWSAEGGGEVAIKNIRETLRNYTADPPRIVRTSEQLTFPPGNKHWPKKRRR
jgi:hypothetical protein